MTMHYLPLALFGPEDARDAQRHGCDLLPSADLGSVALYLHDVGKLGRYVLGHVLEVYDLAVSVTRGGTLHSPSGLIPSAHGRTERVGEAYVFGMGEVLLIRRGVALNKLGRHEMVLLDCVVEIVYGNHPEITPMIDTSSFPQGHSFYAGILRYLPNCVEGEFSEVPSKVATWHMS